MPTMRRFAWLLHPLRDVSQSRTFRLNFDRPAGDSFSYYPDGAFESRAGVITIKSSYHVYVPTDDDLAILRKRFPSQDAENPSWATIEAELIASGREHNDLKKLNAPTLIRFLERPVSPSAMRDDLAGSPDMSVGAQAVAQGTDEPASTGSMSKEARALAVLTDHPDWTDEQIANAAGCSRTALYRMQLFRQARAIQKAASVPKGSKSKSGEIEAWTDDQ